MNDRASIAVTHGHDFTFDHLAKFGQSPCRPSVPDPDAYKSSPAILQFMALERHVLPEWNELADGSLAAIPDVEPVDEDGSLAHRAIVSSNWRSTGIISMMFLPEGASTNT